ncbi:MAG: phosphoenolpyruvate carboxykinase (GTP) [Planctomycetes bacterium]|nr:phosphoenolpyruvate carboxykinase (GTP) [Planctomycetota bacterium]
MSDHQSVLKAHLTDDNLAKLTAVNNPKMHRFIAEAITLCKPERVFVCTDDPVDIAYLREGALTHGEEQHLETEGHTIHFDGPKDMARDKGNTKYLLPEGTVLSDRINSTGKEAGLSEITGFFKDSMAGKEMLVCFFCLGPTDSEFSVSCLQITDSFYVAHSETILYRPGYEQFKLIGDSPDFFRFLHSAGELDGRNCSTHVDKRRIYIDLDDQIVYSVNTQYAGNTVGLKKLALRLAIRKAAREGWLAEHMFLMGVRGPAGRASYFTGAFPSACGKTSTSMISGQTILGDDLAYLRKRGGSVYAANVESGIFGIIQDVNAHDDPVIWDALTSPGEVIFSNILISDNRPYWLGMGKDVEIPETGENYQGRYKKGKTGADGKELPYAHKNARYTIRISQLKNRDAMADAPEGVSVRGIIFGGRDSDTCVPVEQAFDWAHGIITKGASLESESTAATLGKEGVRNFDIMSILDFLSMPLGEYINNYLEFSVDLPNIPSIFSVNYFLKDGDGNYLNSKLDKKAWILWAELRANGDIDAVRAPTGFIPKYADLKQIFDTALKSAYSEDDYALQFAVRVPEHLAKLDRIEKVYRSEQNIPQAVWDTFKAQRERLLTAQEKHGVQHISPFDLA